MLLCFFIAAQMWELVNIFPFIIGKSLYFNHSFLSCDTADQVSYVGILIKEYLQQFSLLYPNQPLTPKCHYLVHIPSLIKRSVGLAGMLYNNYTGMVPLGISGQCSLKGNTEFKRIARKSSFKNIVKTPSLHHQRLMAYNLQPI